MAMFIWRVWCNTEGKYHRVNSIVAPTQCPVNPTDTLDPLKSVILEELGAGGGGSRIEVSLTTDEDIPFARIHESSWSTLGEIIYPGTDAWTPSVSKAIMGRDGSGSESGDFCSGGGVKPASLMLEYTGEDCAASANTQPSDKWSCSGDPLLSASVRIVVNNKSTWNNSSAKVWHDATVALNGLFLAAGSNAGQSKLGSNTWVHILSIPGDTVLQTVKFHTSCSQPLFANDQFGGIIVRSFIADSSGSNGGDSTGPGTNGPASRYRYRLYDLTNGNVIAQIPDGGGDLSLNVLEEIFEATQFSNLSATQAVIEIQAHKNAVANGDDDGRLYHVTLEE